MPRRSTRASNCCSKNITLDFFKSNFSAPDCIGTGIDHEAVTEAEYIEIESKGDEYAFLDGSDIAFPKPLSQREAVLRAAASAARSKCAASKSPKQSKSSSAACKANSQGNPLDELDYESIMLNKQLCYNTAFAGVSNLRQRHHYRDESEDTVPRDTMRRLVRELKCMSGFGTQAGGLVLTNNVSMFLRCDEDRPQHMRAVITGVADTPYAFGCFVFDLFVPACKLSHVLCPIFAPAKSWANHSSCVCAWLTLAYPSIPPKCIHITPGTEKVYGNHTPGGMSPNLHRDSGKVCLSLLGTWDGPGWDAERSTIYQLLITISFQILAAEQPYYMEPGHGGWEGTMPATPSAEAVIYKEEVQRGNMFYGMITPLTLMVFSGRGPQPVQGAKSMRESPWFGFRDVLLRHFYLHRFDIVTTCLKWLGETTCNFHKEAISWMTLRLVELLSEVVVILTQDTESKTEYLRSQMSVLHTKLKLASDDDNFKPRNPPSGGQGAPWTSGQCESSPTRMWAKLVDAAAYNPANTPTANEEADAAKPSVSALLKSAELRQKQLEVAAQAKAVASRKAQAKLHLCRFKTHLEAANEVHVPAEMAAQITDSLSWIKRHEKRVAKVEAVAAAVMHCGIRFDKARRAIKALLSSCLDKSGQIKLSTLLSDHVIASMVLSWAFNREVKRARGIHRTVPTAIVHAAMVKAISDREQSLNVKQDNSSLGIGDCVWRRMDGNKKQYQHVKIVDVQHISSTKRSFEVEYETTGEKEWVFDSQIALFDYSLVYGASDMICSVMETQVKEIFDHNVGFVADQVKSTPLPDKTKQGRLIQNPRAPSKGGPKSEPEYILVGVGRGGTHTVTSNAVQEARNAIRPQFATELADDESTDEWHTRKALELAMRKQLRFERKRAVKTRFKRSKQKFKRSAYPTE